MTPMTRMTILAVAMCAAACGQAPQQQDAAASKAAQTLAPAPISKPPAMIPRPESVAEVDRLILAGYTPHADHLHAPGVNECPMSKGTDAVM